MALDHIVEESRIGELSVYFFEYAIVPDLVNSLIGPMVLDKVHPIPFVPLAIVVIDNFCIVSASYIGCHILVDGPGNEAYAIKGRSIGCETKQVSSSVIAGVAEASPHAQDIVLVAHVGQHRHEHLVVAVPNCAPIEDVGRDGLTELFKDSAVMHPLNYKVRLLLGTFESVDIVLFP